MVSVIYFYLRKKSVICPSSIYLMTFIKKCILRLKYNVTQLPVGHIKLTNYRKQYITSLIVLYILLFRLSQYINNISIYKILFIDYVFEIIIIIKHQS